METTVYTTLTRQSGLLRELSIVANNVANASTTGFRKEGLVFSEHVVAGRNGDTLSMANGQVRRTSLLQGPLNKTGGRFDFAIEGEGFFLIETPAGERLTRAGSFSLSAEGELVTNDGFRVLDAGGAPVFIPRDAHDISVSSDGTFSSNGRPLAQIGLYEPVERSDLVREDGVRFRVSGNIQPLGEARMLQGFLEGANVDQISQVARLVEVQRAYEMGQSFLEVENERVRSAIDTFFR